MLNLILQKRFKSINTKAEWLNRQSNDKFVGLRHRQNFRCRSSYKLLEILSKFPQLTTTNNKFSFGELSWVDLGGSPGGWAQVLEKQKKARVVVVDQRYIEPLEGVEIIKSNVNDPKLIPQLLSHSSHFHLVTSDMAHNFTGTRSVDGPRMLGLVLAAYNVAEKLLVNGGGFVSKYIECEDSGEYRDFLASKFDVCNVYKPKSSRLESAEQFFVCWGFKGPFN